MNLFEDVEATVTTLRAIIRDIPQRYEQNSKNIKLADHETQDYLHLLELTKFNASEGCKISKSIQKVRQARRTMLDENDLLEPVIEVLTKIKELVPEINRALGEIRKQKNFQENRTYNTRVRHELSEKINQANKVG
jgi:hypothetical protein